MIRPGSAGTGKARPLAKAFQARNAIDEAGIALPK
jgi:hypothetical protein